MKVKRKLAEGVSSTIPVTSEEYAESEAVICLFVQNKYYT